MRAKLDKRNSSEAARSKDILIHEYNSFAFTLLLFSLCYVGNLTKPKVQKNLVASKPVVPSDFSFLWVGFPPCGLPLLTFPEFVVAWRADTFSLLRQSPSTSCCGTGSRAAFLLYWPPSIFSSLHPHERIHEPTSRAMNFSGTVRFSGLC